MMGYRAFLQQILDTANDLTLTLRLTLTFPISKSPIKPCFILSSFSLNFCSLQ